MSPDRRDSAPDVTAEDFHFLVNAVTEYAIFMLDPTGHVRTWNKGAERIKGWTASEIIGQHFSTFYPEPEKNEKPARMLEIARAEGKVEDEGWRVRKDGSRFWANVVITALFDDSGELRGFAKVTRDLTERKRAEEQLRRSEERFRIIVESIRDYAIFMLDRDGNISTWNRGAQAIKGYEPEEVIGRHFSMFYTPEDIRNDRPHKLLDIARRDGTVEDEAWRVRKDGSRFWANVVLTALYDPSGNLIGFAKVTRDLTQRREGEERVRQALERERRTSDRLRELDRLKNDFVAIVAHDLRSPMSVIQGYADLMTSSWDSLPEADKLLYLDTISRNISSLAKLVEDVLQVARIDAGELRYEIKHFDLVALAHRVTDELSPPGQERRIRVSAQDDLPLARGDERRNWEIMSNLISNALKFSPADLPVEVDITPDGGFLAVRVTDHGKGIAPADMPKLFKKFSRVGEGAMRESGTGLGLYICKQMVEAQGGTISVDSTPGLGSTFTYTMPTASVSREGSVLLVVEDDEDMRALVRLTLGRDPRITLNGEAPTAREAIEHARAAQPALIILDHFIEGDIMGLEAAPMLKAAVPEAKILLLTSHDLAVEAEREPAIDAFLRKAQLGKLLPTVQELLGFDRS